MCIYTVIRPWRLQPEVQRNINKKCDPVALYQKYQREWKQISFPGEAKHSKIRWAVREKMLGGDLLPVVGLIMWWHNCKLQYLNIRPPLMSLIF